MRENLKNVVLFMASSGYLVSPTQDASKRALWDETWKRVDRFLPELRNDLALEGLGVNPSPADMQGGVAGRKHEEASDQASALADEMDREREDQSETT